MNRDPEHIRGVGEPLPAGERILWQGAPEWRVLARRAFHVRKVALYFGALLVWRAAVALTGGEPFATVAGPILWLAVFGAASTGVLALLAWASARTATYAITSKRIVMRVGVALPMTVNIPLHQIAAAGLRENPDGTGDVPLALLGNVRIAWLHLWPHVRAWRLSRPEPMLRSIPEARRVAAILAAAAEAAAVRSVPIKPDEVAPAHPLVAATH